MKIPAALAFDMDGVLLDSNGIKHNAMLELFDVGGHSKELIDRYNKSAGGVPRRQKFLHIWTRILGRPFSADVEQALGQRYERILQSVLGSAPLVEGVVEFISCCRCPCFVCTSAPVSEAIEILDRKGVSALFREFYGSPIAKVDALHQIARCAGVSIDRVLFFGDAMADLLAARTSGAAFIGIAHKADNFIGENIAKLSGFADRELLGRTLLHAGFKDVGY